MTAEIVELLPFLFALHVEAYGSSPLFCPVNVPAMAKLNLFPWALATSTLPSHALLFLDFLPGDILHANLSLPSFFFLRNDLRFLLFSGYLDMDEYDLGAADYDESVR